jgi:hypothetical protein
MRPAFSSAARLVAGGELLRMRPAAPANRHLENAFQGGNSFSRNQSPQQELRVLWNEVSENPGDYSGLPRQR